MIEPLELLQPQLDVPIDRLQATIGRGEVLRQRRIRSVDRSNPDRLRCQHRQLAGTACEGARLDGEKTGKRLARRRLARSFGHGFTSGIECPEKSLQPTLMVMVAGPGTLNVREPPRPPLPTVRCTIDWPCGEGVLSRRSRAGFCATFAAVRATTLG